MSIPTLMLFKNGEIASRQVGAAPKQKLQQWISGRLSARTNFRTETAGLVPAVLFGARLLRQRAVLAQHFAGEIQASR